MTDSTVTTSPFPLPRFAQELLSTFSTSLGEVALQPATGGVFVVEIVSAMADGDGQPSTQQKVLWDRQTDGGFPETKELKRRVRDVIEPGRDLGHVDRDHGAKAGGSDAPAPDSALASASGASASAAGGDEKPEEERTEQQQQQHHHHRPRPGDLLKDAIERSQPRPPPLHSQWGGNPIQRVNPGGGVGGVRPLVKEPPEVANNIVRQKLAAKERARLEAEGHAGGGYLGSDDASASQEQNAKAGEQGEEKKEVCEDCS
ncbi:putative selenoprotein w family protein [Phaeoacremonium minimum UCRPA7]|uniref:Putative selenoprotein w family protein n=1 Tax=Phaeoacremonium minimum (strain UCR-PA7) TaxID=1286976 RepID=R8BYN9_PHAM7|nr:putative selenoprotein w family protein [Phaeoacremonium minimum UCRPA7]EOO04394.1 putative selenoprotein w family protein [Phaeoacremonium minimum UCRPA7]